MLHVYMLCNLKKKTKKKLWCNVSLYCVVVMCFVHVVTSRVCHYVPVHLCDVFCNYLQAKISKVESEVHKVKEWG